MMAGMEREQKPELTVLQITEETGESTKFSVELANENERMDHEYLSDLVEEAIMDACGSGKCSICEIGDIVAFALQEEGFIVRDFPNEVNELSFDVTKYREPSMELD